MAEKREEEEEPFFNLFLLEAIDGEKGEQGIAAATKNAITNARLQETINPNCSGLGVVDILDNNENEETDFY